jgi:glutathione S-transferase
MPLLEIDGKMFSQSMAILRYVGKITGLYPEDPIEALRVDEFLDSIIDTRSKISQTYALPEIERITARQKLTESFIKPHLARIECRVKNGGSTAGFAVGEKLTIADLAIANEIAGLRSGRLDGIDTHIGDDCPALLKLVEKVSTYLSH